MSMMAASSAFIDGKPDAHILEGAQHGERGFEILHQGAFRDVESKQARLQAGFVQHGANAVQAGPALHSYMLRRY